MPAFAESTTAILAACDLCGMRKEGQRLVNRKGPGITAGFESREETLVEDAPGDSRSGRPSGEQLGGGKTCPGIDNYWQLL
jgi:hypothetical protein